VARGLKRLPARVAGTPRRPRIGIDAAPPLRHIARLLRPDLEATMHKTTPLVLPAAFAG
jgi:hypothetical protein